MNNDWHKKPIDPTDVRSLSTRHGIDLLAASIFTRREITGQEEIRYFLEDDLSLLHNPYLFHDMDVVVERILQARDEGEKVLVFGDRDADGITSTVLMIEALNDLGIVAEWALPLGDDPYGLTREALDRFAATDGTLLITVDCGISNHDEIEHGNSLGIDTIVIDHHNPQELLPQAYAIINPKIEDTGYPFRDLAGCGVAVKVVWALLFAQTRYHNHPVCLLNVRPANDSYILEAALVQNLMEIDRIVETIVPGLVDLQNTRLVTFLRNREIVVYDAPGQLRMLQTIFGNGVDIGLSDLAPEIQGFAPELAGKSLLKILEETGIGTGRPIEDADDAEHPTALGEIDTLVALFARFVTESEKEFSSRFAQSLDLVAIGTLADLMPLRNENRILVKAGLRALSSTEREGLRELLFRKNLYGKKIGTSDIGWQISPLLNATGRLGVPDVAARLLLSKDPDEQRLLSDEILELNTKRRKLGDEAWDKVLEGARKSHEELSGKLVVVGGTDIFRGITGILASRLAKYFNAPSIVVAILDGKAVGSARSVNGIHIKRLLDELADLFIDYGGHDFAAGFSIELERYDELIRRFGELSADLDEGAEGSVIEIDAELPDKYMTPRLRDLLDMFEPYGEANPPLSFMVRGARITEISLIGKREQNHVRLLIDTGTSKWPAVFWNAAERVGRDFAKNDQVDVAFRLGINNYQNQENLQLTVLDITK
jgi:single-stranded-DNA-specific exonuclease